MHSHAEWCLAKNYKFTSILDRLTGLFSDNITASLNVKVKSFRLHVQGNLTAVYSLAVLDLIDGIYCGFQVST